MNANLHLLVCQYYLREAEAVLRDEGLKDVTASAYPDLCVHPQSERMTVVQQLYGQSGVGERTVVLVGACFLLRPADGPLAEDDLHRIHRETLCFHMFMPRAMADHYLAAGAYLVTPGWLDEWRQHITAWGFDQPTARTFFAETTRRLVLLDTGIDPAARANLAACADYLALPHETLPVGLDHFRLVLMRIVNEWRTENAHRQTAAAIGAANRKLADYMTALDLLTNLTRLMTEAEAIRGIAELFTMLYGATRVEYTPAEEAGGEGKPRLAEGEAYAVSDRGFCLRLAYRRQTLGLLCADIPDFQKHRDDYLNLALSVVNLCGLAVANARAMSERERAEEEVRVKSEALARSNADLEQFAYVISHDLQAPLRRIMAFGDMLREDAGTALNDAARDHLARIQKSAAHLREMIEGLLACSRVSTRGNPFRAVDLAAVARHAVDDLAPRLEETGGRVDVAPLPVVWADELQMYQLLQNLVGNALKFVPRGVRPEVRVSSRPVEAGTVEVSVTDNGIGFDDQKDLERIFQPFQRLHGESEYPGSGIGLAVCRRIVQRHGGTLTAHSRPGQGATFVFTLPVQADV